MRVERAVAGACGGNPAAWGLGALMAHPARQVASPFQRRRGNPAHSGGWAGVRDSYMILSTTYGSSCACTRVRVSARCSTLHRADSFCLGLGLCPAVLWSARSVDGVLVSRRGMGTLKQICRGLPVWPPRLVLLCGGACPVGGEPVFFVASSWGPSVLAEGRHFVVA